MMWSLASGFFLKYRISLLILAFCSALIAAFGFGVQVETWRNQAVEVERAKQEAEQLKKAIDKAAKLQATVDNIEKGAAIAVKGVYAYYAKNPRIKYVDRNDCVLSTTGGEAGFTPTADDSDPRPSDNGHTAAGSTQEVQVIQPNLLPRCAETTVQALTCRDYVNEITKLYNESSK